MISLQLKVYNCCQLDGRQETGLSAPSQLQSQQFPSDFIYLDFSGDAKLIVWFLFHNLFLLSGGQVHLCTLFLTIILEIPAIFVWFYQFAFFLGSQVDPLCFSVSLQHLLFISCFPALNPSNGNPKLSNFEQLVSISSSSYCPWKVIFWSSKARYLEN